MLFRITDVIVDADIFLFGRGGLRNTIRLRISARNRYVKAEDLDRVILCFSSCESLLCVVLVFICVRGMFYGSPMLATLNYSKRLTIRSNTSSVYLKRASTLRRQLANHIAS